MAKIITSVTNEMIKATYKLLHGGKSQYIAIENVNLITPAFCQDNALQLLFCTQHWYQLNAPNFKFCDTKIIIVNDTIINRLGFTETSQEALAVIKYTYQHFEPIPTGTYFILDNIQDPGNLGTILRNAVAFNFNEIYIHTQGVSPTNAKVIRSTMSALLSIKINFYDDLPTLVTQLEKLNIEVYATAIDSHAMTLNNFLSKKGYAIILGNEAHGIDPKHLKNIKKHLYIPINGIDSLNVANACAIIMYHLKNGELK